MMLVGTAAKAGVQQKSQGCLEDGVRTTTGSKDDILLEFGVVLCVSRVVMLKSSEFESELCAPRACSAIAHYTQRALVGSKHNFDNLSSYPLKCKYVDNSSILVL
jgi:hypothetical protein